MLPVKIWGVPRSKAMLRASPFTLRQGRVRQRHRHCMLPVMVQLLPRSHATQTTNVSQASTGASQNLVLQINLSFHEDLHPKFLVLHPIRDAEPAWFWERLAHQSRRAATFSL